MYRLAGRVLERLEQREGSLKALAFAASKTKGKKVYALAVETVKRYEAIKRVVEESRVIPDSGVDSVSKVNLCALYVAVYDFLFGKQSLEGRGWPVNIVKKNAFLLKRTWQTIKRDFTGKFPTVSSATDCSCPVRYARINVLKESSESVMGKLLLEGYKEVSESDFWSLLESSPSSQNDTLFFTRDPTIPCLLVFPHQSPVQSSPLYRNGHLLLQDKASCMPAFVLSPSHDCHVIDACAAPGNKTTHLAAILENSGRIDAFEIDPKRSSTLRRMVSLAGATCVKVHCQDFLTVDPMQYSSVTHILLDPSCTGSGMTNRIEHPGTIAQGPDPERLKSLSGFQLKALLHALSFPAVVKVVYSTCSIHQEENEDVVKSALEKVGHSFELEHILPAWQTRGFPTFPQGWYFDLLVCMVKGDGN
jgi:putative methyltransferase